MMQNESVSISPPHKNYSLIVDSLDSYGETIKMLYNQNQSTEIIIQNPSLNLSKSVHQSFKISSPRAVFKEKVDVVIPNPLTETVLSLNQSESSRNYWQNKNSSLSVSIIHDHDLKVSKKTLNISSISIEPMMHLNQNESSGCSTHNYSSNKLNSIHRHHNLTVDDKVINENTDRVPPNTIEVTTKFEEVERMENISLSNEQLEILDLEPHSNIEKKDEVSNETSTFTGTVCAD